MFEIQKLQHLEAKSFTLLFLQPQAGYQKQCTLSHSLLCKVLSDPCFSGCLWIRNTAIRSCSLKHAPVSEVHTGPNPPLLSNLALYNAENSPVNRKATPNHCPEIHPSLYCQKSLSNLRGQGWVWSSFCADCSLGNISTFFSNNETWTTSAFRIYFFCYWILKMPTQMLGFF